MKQLIVIALLFLSFGVQAEWAVVTGEDAFDGTMVADVGQMSSNDDGYMKVHCESDSAGEVTLFAILNFGEYFSDGWHEVDYRVDADDPKTLRFMKVSGMLAATDDSNRIYGEFENFLTEIKAGTKLVVRATPWKELAITMTFDLVGFTTAYNQATEVCNK